MKNWMRIILVVFVLFSSVAFFGYWYTDQFKQVFDNLSAPYLANTRSTYQSSSKPAETASSSSDNGLAELASTSYEDVEISTDTELASASLGADLKLPSASSVSELSFTFPQSNTKIYVGCTYPISWEPSATISLLEVTLVDAGSRATVEPAKSGLAKEYEMEPDSQDLEWKVGFVWPGKYYIKISDADDATLRSGVFTISTMPKGISADEREAICKKSGGSF